MLKQSFYIYNYLANILIRNQQLHLQLYNKEDCTINKTISQNMIISKAITFITAQQIDYIFDNKKMLYKQIE